LPNRYPTSRLQACEPTWTSLSFTLPNLNQTKPNKLWTQRKKLKRLVAMYCTVGT
jgi:hypothetical protein